MDWTLNVFASSQQKRFTSLECEYAWIYTWNSLSTWMYSLTHLHKVDDVQEELVSILLSHGGELWVTPANQGLQHPRRDAPLLVLEWSKRKMQMSRAPHQKRIFIYQYLIFNVLSKICLIVQWHLRSQDKTKPPECPTEGVSR